MANDTEQDENGPILGPAPLRIEAMPQVIPHADYLEVHIVPAALNPTSKQVYVDSAAGLCVAYGARRLLVVCEDPDSRLALDEAYWLGDAIARKLADVRTAIAVTCRALDSLDEFSARVARERGATVRYFDTIEPALRWLRAEEESA